MSAADEIQTRERMVRLEMQVEHLTEVADKQAEKIDEMHDVLMQAKGARWIIVGTAAIVGVFASFAAKYFPFASK